MVPFPPYSTPPGLWGRPFSKNQQRKTIDSAARNCVREEIKGKEKILKKKERKGKNAVGLLFRFSVFSLFLKNLFFLPISDDEVQMKEREEKRE